MKLLPLVFWPIIALLVLGGVAYIAEESETIAALAAAFALFGTFAMTARDS